MVKTWNKSVWLLCTSTRLCTRELEAWMSSPSAWSFLNLKTGFPPVAGSSKRPSKNGSLRRARYHPKKPKTQNSTEDWETRRGNTWIHRSGLYLMFVKSWLTHKSKPFAAKHEMSLFALALLFRLLPRAINWYQWRHGTFVCFNRHQLKPKVWRHSCLINAPAEPEACAVRKAFAQLSTTRRVLLKTTPSLKLICFLFDHDLIAPVICHHSNCQVGFLHGCSCPDTHQEINIPYL